MSQPNIQDTALRIVKTLKAPIEKVYQAWTDPSYMSQWMGPGNTKCNDVQIDLRVGGQYRIEMETDDCEHPIAIGEYKEIIENKRLQFTWTWEGSGMPDTLVTIDLQSTEDGTDLTLLHEQFPDKETTEKHTMGWNGCLDNLIDYLD